MRGDNLRLYQYKDFHSYEKKIADIKTPLGIVKFDFKVKETSLSCLKPNHLYKDSANNTIVCWYTSDFEAELLIFRPKISIPQGMQVKDCLAAVWRVKSLNEKEDCVFSAEWCEGYTWKGGGSDSGEHLDAQTWYNDEYQISIGTQDGEMLEIRKKHKDMLPVEFNYDVDPIELVKYTERGLVVPIKSIYPKEICQIHFAVAWSGKKEYDSSTWYAVDLSTTQLFEGFHE